METLEVSNVEFRMSSYVEFRTSSYVEFRMSSVDMLILLRAMKEADIVRDEGSTYLPDLPDLLYLPDLPHPAMKAQS
jgi:hypothetical protein